MNINVNGNTHLKGGIITSLASADKNTFTTQSLTSEDIENHSAIETQSVGASIGTDMSKNALSAAGSVLGMAGNKNDHDETQTRSAISANIKITSRDGKAVTVSRDTNNTNQRVGKFDLAKVQEQQEAAQVVGDIVNSAVETYLDSKAKAAEKQKQAIEYRHELGIYQLGDFEAMQSAQNTINTYGKGSMLQLGIRTIPTRY